MASQVALSRKVLYTSLGCRLDQRKELLRAVRAHLPADLFPGGSKAGWWMKTVQLDLEAKGIIAREQTRPAEEDPARSTPQDAARLLTPFDPVVHDRARFELLWDWIYRFEAYTPAPKRKLGYYAMPLLWQDRVIGWGNLSVRNGELKSELGYVGSPPRDRDFKRELEAELDRMRTFLGLES